nr:hypothetical protein [Pandoravirus aubagnensis]
MGQGSKTDLRRQQHQQQQPIQQQQTRPERQRRRGGCMQRLLVGELRSYSTAFEGMAMLDTVATALIAGVINSGRAYPGAKVLSLTALDHDAYPPGSGLCTMVCVVRWCGPPGVAWVATDLDLAPSRFPESDVIAQGALPDGLVVEFHRAGLLHTPRMSSEASRPLPPPPRFVVAALRPHLCATVQVAPDGSVLRRCAQPSNACGKCDRIWRTSIRLIAPPTSTERCDLGTLTRDAVPAYVTRAIAKAIVSTLASTKSLSPAVAPADAPSARIHRSHQDAIGPQKHRPQQSRLQPPPQQQRHQQDAPPKETQPLCATRAPTRLASALLHDDDRSPKGPRVDPRDDDGGGDSSSSTNARTILPTAGLVIATRPAFATSPSIIVHARCAAAGCGAASRAGTGKIVRVECTAGCRVTFHRSCWRTMAIEPSDARPCMTPDCWGLWTRVTSTRRNADGSETPAYVEWARAPRRSPNPNRVQAHARKRHTLATIESATTAARRHESAASESQSNRNGTPTTTATESDDTYVGRIRRRRLRQNQSGPPHKRMESIKALGRPLVSEATEAGAATPVVVAGGARVKSALVEQEMTRAKRRLTTMPTMRGSAALGGATLLAKKARTPRSTKGPRADKNSDTACSGRALDSEDMAATPPPSTFDRVDKHEPAPVDLNGAWAAFFEWDHVPPSLVPEMPAARPSTDGLWTPPPLLVMTGGDTALCCPAAVWSCFCQRAMAA